MEVRKWGNVLSAAYHYRGKGANVQRTRSDRDGAATDLAWEPGVAERGGAGSPLAIQMCDELKRLIEEEQAAIRRAEEAAHMLNGPQPVPPISQEEAALALRERIAARERVSEHRAEHGC